MNNFPKYIKTTDGLIGKYAYHNPFRQPVYSFQADNKYKFRTVQEEEILKRSDNLTDLINETSQVMQWKQTSSTIWEAVGKDGIFRIERSLGKKCKFWAFYASEDFSFNMPPKDTLMEAKKLCEDNQYWECTV